MYYFSEMNKYVVLNSNYHSTFKSIMKKTRTGTIFKIDGYIKIFKNMQYLHKYISMFITLYS